MSKRLLILLVVALIPSILHAGKIYGIIKEGGKPIGKGVTVTITTLPDSEGNYEILTSASTDANGLYKFYIKDEGSFQLIVSDDIRYKNNIPPYEVRSYLKSIRYNLIIEKDKQGNYSLRRE